MNFFDYRSTKNKIVRQRFQKIGCESYCLTSNNKLLIFTVPTYAVLYTRTNLLMYQVPRFYFLRIFLKYNENGLKKKYIKFKKILNP